MRIGRPGHPHGFDYIGRHRYFLTFCTDNRRPLFADSEAVDLVRAEILHAAGRERFRELAYCFMPDEVHLLVEGTVVDADCRRFISLAKQRSGFHYGHRFGTPLWGRDRFERTLRGEESTLSVARHILENPVRAGLADRVGDYPFAGSSVYTIEQIAEGVQVQSVSPRHGARRRSG